MTLILTEILNDEEIDIANEKIRSDFMRIIEINGDILGVEFLCMYARDKIKYIPASLVPKEYQKSIEPNELFVVRGNLLTKYVRSLKFVECYIAPEPDPNDGLA